MQDSKIHDINADKFLVKTNQIINAIFPKSLTPSEMDLLSVMFTTIKSDDRDF